MLKVEAISNYLKNLYGGKIRIIRVGGELAEDKETIKGFGYGNPLPIEVEIAGRKTTLIIETMKEDIFGHDYLADRAHGIVLAYTTFNRLPRHKRVVDIGVITKEGEIKSLSDPEEFFILTEKIEGKPYYLDLERIKQSEKLTELDLERARALSKYLAEIHSQKNASKPHLYIRRLRDLVGHGECIMGLIDSYMIHNSLQKIGIDENFLQRIELNCVKWRWKLRKHTDRLCQIHGDFHPWNILFREGTDFSLLDRSRGEWGEAADDVAALTINYLFYSLQKYGCLSGPFKTLFETFFETYLRESEDYDLLKIIQPYYAWRGLVIASPIWYPTLPLNVRSAIFTFIDKVLETDKFDPYRVNDYIIG